MDFITLDRSKGVGTFCSPYTESQSSPVKHSASNPATGQPLTRVHVDTALKHELSKGRFFASDLGDLMFRSVISTKLASEVLHGLLKEGTVEVLKVVGQRETKVPRISGDANTAIDCAYARALVHGCKRPGVDLERTKTPRKHKVTDVIWKWTWKDYPRTTIVEKRLVDYLNGVIDTALSLDCLHGRELRYRFAVPHDTHHRLPLAYGPRDEDMRPDFIVLPIEAFRKVDPEKPGDRVTYELKKEWSNFTTIRLSGECKTSDTTKGVDQVQRYMRGMRRAQPWQRFVTAMSISRTAAVFIRGDGSGTERLLMEFHRGWASLEFVRVLLAIALADPELFGKSQHIDVAWELKKVPVARPSPAPVPPSSAVESDAELDVPTSDASLIPRTSDHRSSKSSRSNTRSSRSLRTPRSIASTSVVASTSGSHASQASQKRKRDSEDAFPGDRGSRYSQKRTRLDDDQSDAVPPVTEEKSTEEAEAVEYMVQAPTTLFKEYVFEGTLFNAASIRGRGTVVLVVHRNDVPKVRVALKISWQDIARKFRRDEVLRLLFSNDAHENVLYPTRYVSGLMRM